MSSARRARVCGGFAWPSTRCEGSAAPARRPFRNQSRGAPRPTPRHPHGHSVVRHEEGAQLVGQQQVNGAAAGRDKLSRGAPVVGRVGGGGDEGISGGGLEAAESCKRGNATASATAHCRCTCPPLINPSPWGPSPGQAHFESDVQGLAANARDDALRGRWEGRVREGGAAPPPFLLRAGQTRVGSGKLQAAVGVQARRGAAGGLSRQLRQGGRRAAAKVQARRGPGRRDPPG